MEEMTPAEIKRMWLALLLCLLATGAGWAYTLDHFAEERCVMRASDEVARLYQLEGLSLPEAYAVPGAVEAMAERRADCEARYGD